MTQPTDANNRDPQIDPLRNNGGSTLTHALRASSPAIDSALTAGCSVTDQRGATRPTDGNGDSLARCDIGAYEYLSPVAIATSDVAVVDEGQYDWLVVALIGLALGQIIWWWRTTLRFGRKRET